MEEKNYDKMSLKELLKELKAYTQAGAIPESLTEAIEKKSIGGLDFVNLKSLDGLVLPREVRGPFKYGGTNDKQEPEGLNLVNLTSLDGLKIPKPVGDHFEYGETSDEREQGERGSRLGR